LADLEGIEILQQLFPKIPQVAVFDTAFHHTLPASASVYPGPYEWVKEGIQRYGFHGISFQYCTRRASAILGKVPEKMVICHLGSGASLCAVKNGKSVDTTMGFTPLEGLMMDTRSGTVDPGILLYLLKKKTLKELSQELYEKSGLLGLSGVSSDMRDVLEKAAQSNKQASLAIDVYIHRLVSSIGSMIATLSGIDALVFTAGIGENAPLIRERVCSQFSFLGVHLSQQQPTSEDRVLSSPDAKVKVLLIHTKEAFEIARECLQILRP
jgi:acetate kinase